MAESHILIALFKDLKQKIMNLKSKNAMMDVNGIHGMNEVVKSCDIMDRYIDSFVYKEEHAIHIAPPYDSFSLTPIPRGHVGPTAAMMRYAGNEEKKVMDRIDRVAQMGRELDANKETPYF